MKIQTNDMRGEALGAPERRLILALGRSLHRLGASSPTVEEALGRLSEALGEHAQVFATPTSLFVAFGGEGPAATTHLLRGQPGDVDLGRLADVDALLEALIAGRLPVEDALARLERPAPAVPRHGTPARLAAFALASVGAAVFFGGGVEDAGAAALLGTLLGMGTLVTGRWVGLARLQELLGALVVSLLAGLMVLTAPGLQPALVTLAALIVYVPGYTVTVALGEVAERHWVSGTARLTGAAGIFLILGLGVALGHRLLAALLGDATVVPDTAPTPLPPWALPAALVATPVAFAVLFRARRRDTLVILGAGLVAWSGARLGGWALGAEVGAFVGAVALGLGSNLVGRLRSCPAAVPLVPGLMLLVPGSLGYRSVAAFLEQDAVAGVEAAAATALVAASLAGGLLCANGLFPSRRSL